MGSVSLAGTTLTYSFSPIQVAAGTAVSIRIGGITNPATAGASSSQITTRNGASPVDSGPTGTVTFTAGQLTNLGWSASSTAVGATNVGYTYTFTTATTAQTITSFTMTVPPGTSGSPTVGAVSPPQLLGSTVTLSGTTLTLSGLSLPFVIPTAVSIQINGLTNTTAAGSYTSEIVSNGALASIDSGVTPALSFSGTLNLTSPSSLIWAATLTGSNLSVTDVTAGDQQFTLDDETGTGAGWHITVAATTLTNGSHTLANAGTFVFTGSTSSVTAITAPSASCSASCTPPVNTTTYPVAITTAASSPTPATVISASAGSGMGPVVLGGHSAASPAGWWVNVPANATAGSYVTTVTVAVVSGP